MKATALSRFNMISARKARLVAELVRGKSVEEAVAALSLTSKKASPLIQKTILQAVANARQTDEGATLADDEFVVSEIRVDEGPTYKRIRARAQGRAYRLRKRLSHIKVTVSAATTPGRDMGHQPANLHDRMPGYAIIRIDRDTRRITLEAWPRASEPGLPPEQYPGWPVEFIDDKR